MVWRLILLLRYMFIPVVNSSQMKSLLIFENQWIQHQWNNLTGNHSEEPPNPNILSQIFEVFLLTPVFANEVFPMSDLWDGSGWFGGCSMIQRCLGFCCGHHSDEAETCVCWLTTHCICLQSGEICMDSCPVMLKAHIFQWMANESD